MYKLDTLWYERNFLCTTWKFPKSKSKTTCIEFNDYLLQRVTLLKLNLKTLENWKVHACARRGPAVSFRDSKR